MFTYSNDLLSDISIPDTEEGSLRHVYFTYDSSQRLTGIRYSELGGTSPHTVYTYDGSTAILTRAKNYDGVCVDVGYEAKSRYNSNALVDGANDQMRRVLSLETLHVNDSGAVTKRGAKQNLRLPAHVYCGDGGGGHGLRRRQEIVLPVQRLPATWWPCATSWATASLPSLRLAWTTSPARSPKLRKVVINQLRKIDFASQWTGSGSAVKDSSTRCLGMPSVKLTGNTNDGSYYQQSVTLLPNQTYTFSAYVKTEDVQGGTGALLRLVSADGWTQVDSEPVTGSTPAAIGNEMPADGWQRIKLNYEHTSNAEETFTVRLMLDATTGAAWFSCPQLETGTVANSVNLLSNADFHLSSVSGAQTLPTDWGLSSNDLTTAPTSVFPASDDPDFPAALEGNYMQIEGRRLRSSTLASVRSWTFREEERRAGLRRLGQRPQRAQRHRAGTQLCHYGPLAEHFRPVVEPRPAPVQLGMGRLAVREPRPRRPCRFCQDRLRGRLHRQLQLRQVLEPVPLSRVLRRQLWLQWQPTGAMSPPPPIWRAWKRTWSTIVRTNLYRWVQPGRENTTENRYTNWYGDTDAQRAKHLLLRSRTPGVCH